MNGGHWLILGGVSAGTLVLSVLIAGWILVRVPPDYFKGAARKPLKSRPLWARVLKNLAGGLLVALGLVLSLPGIPGQGLLMVLAGLMLLDIPGKYKLERKLVSIRPIRSAANRLRRWRGRPPLELPQS